MSLATPASNSNNNNDDNFYRVVSTLVQVTQSFLSQVTALQNNTNKHNYEPLLNSVMEHYERLNLVMRVSKIAIPLTLPLYEQERNLMNTTTDQITNTVACSLSTIPTPVIDSTTTSINATAISSVPVVVKQKQEQQNAEQDLKLIEQMMEKTKETTPLEPTVKQEQEQCSLSSNEFLNQFENTAKKFAIQNQMNLKDIWESLFIHALPSNKMDWAHRYILKRSMDWYEAKATYLKYFPDTVKTTLVIKKENAQLQVKKKKQQLPAYVNNAKLMTLVEKTTEEAKNAMVDRQARYAQHLLHLKMKEYDSIDQFNIQFKRYCVAACMNLFDASLSKRYIASLLPKYRQMVTSNTVSLPNNLDDIMSLTAKFVEGHGDFTIQPKPCRNQHSTSLKRVSTEQPEDARMYKKNSCI